MSQPRLPHKPGTYPSALGERQDEYFGLRHLDETELDSVIKSESAHLEKARESWKATRDEMFTKTKAILAAQDRNSYPVPYRNVLLFTHTGAEAEHPIYYAAPLNADRAAIGAGDLTGAWILLDEGALAQERGQAGYAIAGYDISPAGDFVAYADCADGSERYNVHVRDVSNGHELAGPEQVAGEVTWWNSTTLIYTEFDDTQRPWQVCTWNVLTGERTVIHSEPDASMYIGGGLTADRDKLIVAAAGWSGAYANVYARGEGDTLTHLVASPRAKDTHYTAAGELETLVWAVEYPDYTTEVVDAMTGEVLVPNREDVTILASEIDTDGVNLYVPVRDAAGLGLEIWDGPDMVRVNIGEGVDVDLRCSDRRDKHIQVRATSWIDQGSVWEVDPGTGRGVLVHKQPLPGYDPEAYQVRRTQVNARDGAKVPVTIIEQAGTQDQSAPCVVSAYGAYGIAFDAEFSVARAAYLDHGGKYVVVHARGGADLGKRWHDEGRRGTKMNTFTDVVDAVAHLRETGTASRVVLDGGSAGGATVTCATTLAPELVDGVVAIVPFVDALATMSDPTLPQTVVEYDEWGDASTPEGAAWIAQWSPVDNLRTDVTYPPFYIAVGLNDPRVGYWEGLKLAAKLRDQGTEVVVRIDTGAGHAGASSRWEALEQAADSWAFAMKTMGMTPPTRRVARNRPALAKHHRRGH